MITGNLLQSLEHYLECKREHDEARERHEHGHSWDWYGRAHIICMEKAANEFEVALEEYIEQRVKEEMKK